MPIEVRELVIKATITQQGQSEQTARPGNNNNASLQTEVVNTSVEKVLEILKDKMER